VKKEAGHGGGEGRFGRRARKLQPRDLADRQILEHNGLLGQRVDEPRRDNLDLVHLALQKQVAGKGGNWTCLVEPRRIGEGELRDQLPTGAGDELCRQLSGGDEDGRRRIKWGGRGKRES